MIIINYTFIDDMIFLYKRYKVSSGLKNFEKLIKDLYDFKIKNQEGYSDKTFDKGIDVALRAVRDICVEEISQLKENNLELARYIENLSNRVIRGILSARERETLEVKISQAKIEILDDIINLANNYKDQVKKGLDKIQLIETDEEESERPREVGERPVRLKTKRNKLAIED